jgi:hypothetical protein
MSRQIPAAASIVFACLWIGLLTALGGRTETHSGPVGWETVLNFPYANEYAENGVAQLQDGTYHYNGSARDIEVRVSGVRTYLDLWEGQAATALPLITTTGATEGTVLDLATVGRVNGVAQVLDIVRVGSNVQLRSAIPDRDTLRIRLRLFDAGDNECCPSREVIRVFGLQEDRLAMLSEIDVAFAPPSQTVHVFNPQALEVAPGERRSVTGTSTENRIVDYSLQVTAGQRIELRLQGTDVGLSVYGLGSGRVFSSAAEGRSIDRKVEASEELAIRVVPLGWGSRPFEFSVALTDAPTATPPSEPTATAAPEPTATPVPAQPVPEEPLPGPAPPPQAQAPPLRTQPTSGAVYLTFDDGPTLNTYAILDVLDRYGVPATFFVLGSQVVMHPGAVVRAAASGHTIANHSYWHNSLVGMSREVFMSDIGTTQTLIE